MERVAPLTRWLRFTCKARGHISETLDRGQLQEPCKVCGDLVEAVPFEVARGS